ncbi:hypothetical protein LY56_02315 [Roseinatronobacter thiooxidans]|uniref:Uncharacterized protein n=1 Tax=Roseinatronobacter thiooxidans TaxID=121821 RepID=A0A2W7Q248_9RHOB|nr:hypothetical protein LY56_02315 [Roseinatronobacter thiooxidans]
MSQPPSAPVYRTIVYHKSVSDFVDKYNCLDLAFAEQWRAVEDYLCRSSHLAETCSVAQDESQSPALFESVHCLSFGRIVLTGCLSQDEVVLLCVSTVGQHPAAAMDLQPEV